MADENKRPKETVTGDQRQEPTPATAADPGQDQQYRDEILSKMTLFGKKYDPALDPKRPEFDRDRWDSAIAGIREHLRAGLENSLASGGMSPFFDNTLPAAGLQLAEITGRAAEARDFLKGYLRAAADVAEFMQSFFNSDALRDFAKLASEAIQIAPTWIETVEQYAALRPYLEAELQKPEYEGKSIYKLMQEAEDADDRGITPYNDSLFMQAWEAAQEAQNTAHIKELGPYLETELKKAKYKGKSIDDLLNEAEKENTGKSLEETSLFMQAIRAAEAAADKKESAPQITIKRADKVEYPLDKPNSLLWNLLEKDTQGQVTFNMETDKDKKKGVKLITYYAINFDGLGNDISITRQLTPFDKLVYIAAAALFNAGNTVITLSQICYAMGYTTRQGDNIRDKIYKSITKMRTADIFFDNEQEAKKYNYTRFKYEGALLPCEIGQAIINGKKTDKAIHIFREPPLITFAKQRNQITTLDIKLLQAPVSKTDGNLQIQDYLLERISKAKNGKGNSCRILFKTLYSHAGIEEKPKTEKEKKRKQRAPGYINDYLKHYQKESFIKRFTTQKDGITIYW